jgi:hypothetical protein
VKEFLTVSCNLFVNIFTVSQKLYLKETRQKVLRRILLLIDGVLGLEEGHLWRLHQDDQGRTGDDVRFTPSDQVLSLSRFCSFFDT